MDGEVDPTLVAELREAGSRALDRGVSPDGVARALGTCFAAFAAAGTVVAGTWTGVALVNDFCETAHEEVERRVAALEDEVAA